VCRLLYLRSKPTINAFGVEDVSADWDLSDGYSRLEIFKANNAFCQLELIYTLIIGDFLDQSDQLIDALFVSF
jgi:hypothetical protein